MCHVPTVSLTLNVCKWVELRHSLCCFGDPLNVWAPAPWHELIPARRRPVSSDPSDDVGDVSLRLDAVKLADLDNGVDRSSAFAADLRPGEQPVLAADGDAAHRTLGDIIVDLETAIVEDPRERGPALATIGDRLGHLRLGREAPQGIVEHGTQVLDQRRGTLVPDASSDMGRLPADFLLDLVEAGDPAEQIGGERRRSGGVAIEYLAPEVRPAGDLGDRGLVRWPA